MFEISSLARGPNARIEEDEERDGGSASKAEDARHNETYALSKRESSLLSFMRERHCTVHGLKIN
jgi:hypothetical protein